MAVDRLRRIPLARVLAVTLLLMASGIAAEQARAAETGREAPATSAAPVAEVPLVRGVPRAKQIEEMLTRAIRPTHDVKAKEPSQGPSPPAVDILVLFESDSDALTPAAKRQLDEVAATIASESLRNATILIQGHADGVGAANYNQALSEARARAVVSYLAGKPGVNGARLTYEGLGETQLRDPKDSGSAENRRVTFVNIGG